MMKHTLKLTPEERIAVWLDLCDFTFRLMKGGLDKEHLERRLHRMRGEKIKANKAFLTNLGKVSR